MHSALLAALLLIPLFTAAQQPLASLKDHQRVLVVFAPNGRDNSLRNQLANLDDKAMAERDLVLIPVLATWEKSDDDLRAAHRPYTEDIQQASIRRRFRIPPAAFTVLLLGKDGGEKLRSPTPVTMQQLTQLIDAMPMRQQEIMQRQEMKPRLPQ